MKKGKKNDEKAQERNRKRKEEGKGYNPSPLLKSKSATDQEAALVNDFGSKRITCVTGS